MYMKIISLIIKSASLVLAALSAILISSGHSNGTLDYNAEIKIHVSSILMFMTSVLLVLLSSIIDIHKWDDYRVNIKYKIIYNFGITVRLQILVFFTVYFLLILLGFLRNSLDLRIVSLVAYPILFTLFVDTLSFRKQVTKIPWHFNNLADETITDTKSSKITKYEYTRHYRYNLLNLIGEDDPHENEVNNFIEKWYGYLVWICIIFSISILSFFARGD